MNWRTVKRTPETGERRTRSRFAWMPTRLDDGFTVWLETYSVTERFVFVAGSSLSARWVPEHRARLTTGY